MTDSQLCVASAGGQRDAFVELVRRYQGLVCAVTYAATGRRDLSEDLAQETFLVAWRGVGRVRAPERVGAWLARVARNLGRKSLRTRRSEPLAASMVGAGDSDPEETMIDEQARAQLWRVLGTLPVRYREVMVLYYREEESAARVAEILGISVVATEQRLSRGRRQLRDKVERKLSRELARTRPTADLTSRVAAALPLLAPLGPVGDPGLTAPGTHTWGRLVGGVVASKPLAVAMLGLAVLGLFGLWAYGLGPKHADRVRVAGPATVDGAGPRLPRIDTSTDREEPPVVAGVVLGVDSGVPLPHAVVTITLPDGRAAYVEESGQSRSLAVTRVASDGSWAVHGLPRGRYAISAAAPGYLPGRLAWVSLAEVAGPPRIELALRRGGRIVRGRVRDAGGGWVDGAVVRARRSDGTTSATMTDEYGRYEITLANGRFVLAAWEQDYQREDRVVVVNGARRMVDFELVPAASISGRVVDRSSGRVVPGARVSFLRMARTGGGFFMDAAPAVTTDGAGRFVMRQLGAGEYQIRATADHRSSAAPPERSLGIAEQVADVTVYVDPAANVRGRVVDDANHDEGIAGAIIQAHEIGRWTSVVTHSNTDGLFEVQGVADGALALSLHAEGIAPTMYEGIVEVDGRDVEGVVVSLHRGATVQGRVQPAGVSDLRLRPADSAVARGVERAFVRSGDNGEFTISSAPTGDWILVADGVDGRHGEIAVTIPASGLYDVALDLLPRASVRGVLRDQAGAPLLDATVTLIDDAQHEPRQGEQRTRSGVTDGDGGFEFLGTASGGYAITVTARDGTRLVVRSPDAGEGGSRLEVGSDPIDDLEISVHVPEGVVSGVLLGPQGHPHSDGWVALRPLAGGATATRRPQLTGPDGAFSFEHVAAADHVLHAWSADGEATAHQTEIDAGVEVELQLRSRGVVRGRVTSDGKAVTKFHVKSARLFARTFISEDGSFEVARVAAGASTIEISAPEGSLSRRINVVPGAPTELSLRLEPWATFTGRVVSIAGEPVADLSVVVQVRGRNNISSGPGFRATGKGVRTDAAGRFTIERIPTAVVSLLFQRGATPSSIDVGGTQVVVSSGSAHDIGDVVVLTSPLVATELRGTLGVQVRPSFGSPNAGLEPVGPPDGPREAAGLWVVAVHSGGPAARAGLRRGVRILAIDGQSIAEIGAKTGAVLFGRRRVQHGRRYEVTVDAGSDGEQTIGIVAAQAREPGPLTAHDAKPPHD